MNGKLLIILSCKPNNFKLFKAATCIIYKKLTSADKLKSTINFDIYIDISQMWISNIHIYHAF